jgi:hypothetical protein
MKYQEFVNSLSLDRCPTHLEPCLQALWYDAKSDWNSAHAIVQNRGDTMAARIHAYLHRKEGDEWNSKYWHRRAGSVYPNQLSLEQEWESLVSELVDYH